ncbi:MAG: MaoC family dehydratase N-terminal domain-containing protein [Pseudomonadota bacterium]
MDKLNIEAWVGRETVTYGGVSAQLAAQMHATVGTGAAPGSGATLPPLWHWCAFPNVADNAMLGRDGHARGGRLLPPVHLPRRMWAGGALTFHRPLHVDEPLERRSRVRTVTEKMGKAGPMVLMCVDHAIYGAGGLAVEERQDIVYLEIPDSYAPPEKRALPATPVEAVETPETLLFRYSAVTFNAHRIHYDARYAQEVEHYPGLVVHGPLQATLLMRAAMREKGRAPLFFDFRGVHPMFAGTACDIALAEDAEGMRLWTGQSGHQCMQATATWEGTQ